MEEKNVNINEETMAEEQKFDAEVEGEGVKVEANAKPAETFKEKHPKIVFGAKVAAGTVCVGLLAYGGFKLGKSLLGESAVDAVNLAQIPVPAIEPNPAVMPVVETVVDTVADAAK